MDIAHPPFEGSAYPCLLWDHNGTTPDDQKVRIAKSIILGGCRYAVYAGLEADAWHISFDVAFLEAFGPDDAKWGDNFVMTTAHAAESPDDVAHFFVWNTGFDDHEASVEEATARAVAFPLTGSQVSKTARRVFVRDFPFAIVYRPDTEGIVVFAVAHHSRRPEYWQSRVQDR